jgi:Zn-dependent M28 family amino/carboxypeptidase
MTRQKGWIIGGVTLFVLLVLGVFLFKPKTTVIPQDTTFNSDRAYQDVINQIGFGPRTPGSESHQKVIEYIKTELESAGWKVEIQNDEKMGHPVQNIVAQRSKSSGSWVILGAHYDSRLLAVKDNDPVKASLPVPGANDGASGVAVLLEMARVLPKDLDKNVWLVFFDAEDQGQIPGWDWILGSESFVETLIGKPDKVVVIDMIGDADLNIYQEVSSDKNIKQEVWATAKTLGYQHSFIDSEKFNILDDHLPFLEAGIPAIDIIDFDYPYWHTSQDSADKVSAKSLEIVGNTLIAWLNGK